MSEVSATTSTVVTHLDPAIDVTRAAVQVQVLPPQTARGSDANGTIVHTVTPTIQTPIANPSSLLSTVSGQPISQDVSAQITQLTGLRLPADQQQKLLLAAQIQQLTKSSVGTSLPANASFVIQPTFPGSITVMSTSPPSTTTNKVSSQFVSPYSTESTANLTQPTMISLQQQGLQGGSYYEASLQQQMGLHGEHSLQHTTRAHPQTVQWLFDNYETAEGVSLPRSTLYNHYLRHCAATKIDAVNAASFGKLIRSVFIGLKTRRLGTRGNSKYHYYGIRIKPDSPLSTYPTDEAEMPAVAMRQTSQTTPREYQSSESPAEGGEGSTQPQDLTPAQQHQQYLGEMRPELTQFPEVEWEETPIPGAITQDDISEFTAIYREHCEAILDVVVNLQFQMVENLWHHFWAESPKSSSPTQDMSLDDDSDQQLNKEKLVLLTNCQPVIKYLKHCDHILYQCIVDFLIPEVLHPIPGTLTQAIRNFAKSLETSLSGSLHGYPSKFVKAKICSVVAFSQTLRRYTSLNHLAQAARAVLQNPSQISQMLSDLNRVDFANIQEQASWVCECKDSLVLRLEQDFKMTLQQQQSLEQWANWLEEVVNTVLEPYSGGQEFDKAAREFLLKWSFYSSMVIRDLTLRSAASFGSFHLIRLLYDEYMFFLIEHKVAKATGRTPIAVMSEFSGHSKRVLAASESVMSSDIPQDTGDDEDSPPTKKQKVQ